MLWQMLQKPKYFKTVIKTWTDYRKVTAAIKDKLVEVSAVSIEATVLSW